MDQDFQAEGTQSMGQAWGLNVRYWAMKGQALSPAIAATTMERERDWVPVAQDTEQAGQAVYTVYLQSMGQA